MGETQNRSERPKTTKNVQVPYDLLHDLFFYFWGDKRDADREERIKTAVAEKYRALARRENYGRQFDKSLTPEERETARQRYLDDVGTRHSTGD